MFDRSGRLLSIEVTLHDGSTITVEDLNLQSSRYASAALEQFNRGETMECKDGSNTTTYVPFHAVIKVVATARIETEQVSDPMCVEP